MKKSEIKEKKISKKKVSFHFIQLTEINGAVSLETEYTKNETKIDNNEEK